VAKRIRDNEKNDDRRLTAERHASLLAAMKPDNNETAMQKHKDSMIGLSTVVTSFKHVTDPRMLAFSGECQELTMERTKAMFPDKFPTAATATTPAATSTITALDDSDDDDDELD
jgi:hypothetical protein